MKKIILAMAVLISACSSQPIEPTPIPTNTAVPLSAIDLRPVLFQQGDLPANIEAGQIRDFAPEMFNGLPKAENTVHMQLSSTQDGAGGVTVFLYADQSQRESAYEKIVAGMGSVFPVSDVGEKAQRNLSDFLAPGIDLVFMKCTAVTHIRLTTTDELAVAFSYAQQLEKRLSSLVCQ